MKQFLDANQTQFRDLEQRARVACVRFRNQWLPSDCQPDRADVGFEVNAENGVALLYVQKGRRYAGANPEVAAWLETGSKEFPSFSGLVSWLQGPLKDAFAAGAPGGISLLVGESEPPKQAEELTDMETVRQGVQDIHKPLYLDENVIFASLNQRIRGQDAALKSISSVLARHCARRHPARPAVLFSVGPSGVGKTQTAETLAEVLRKLAGDNEGYKYLRLDMTEYQEAHRVSQLIGSPQGYVGHGEGSQLLDTLRANPRTIVLFDEIEKAHPAILRVLMNAMDAGRLSTASRAGGGHEVDCRQSVFIFTSNLDAKAILDELEQRGGFGNKTTEDEVCRRKLQAAGIAPEIVGRIGRFLVYRPLLPETRAEIMTLAIVDVAAEYGVKVGYVEPQVILELLKMSKAEGFGMRPGQFMIDDALGSVFTAAAKLHPACQFRVKGLPFACEPIVEIVPVKPPGNSPPLSQIDNILWN